LSVVDFGNVRSVSVGGAFKLVAGNHAGTSTFTMGANTLNLVAPMSLNFAGGDNTASIVSVGAGRLPAVQMLGGAGNDELEITGGTAEFNIGPINFNGGNGENELRVSSLGGSMGAVKYLGGDGDDELNVVPAVGRVGAVTANFGSGPYVLVLTGTGQSRFTGAINIQAANLAGQTGTSVFSTATYLAPITLKTGEGADTVQVTDSLFLGTVNVSTLGGADTINIETGDTAIPSVFHSAVNLSLGAGADTLNIGSNSASGHAEFKSVAKFDGGPDADTAHISSALFLNVYLPGQPQVTAFEVED
jgi:hypothetical protein